LSLQGDRKKPDLEWRFLSFDSIQGPALAEPWGDDSVNSTLYGEAGCTPWCTLPPHCGDGAINAREDCDDGTNDNDGTYGGCNTNCTFAPFCGDGIVDPNADEECDDGLNIGGYGYCDVGCVLGPRCGDGSLQPDYEQCDDGNAANDDGCSAHCRIEPFF
jgi:cysteine-rich repeat protein